MNMIYCTYLGYWLSGVSSGFTLSALHTIGGNNIYIYI